MRSKPGRHASPRVQTSWSTPQVLVDVRGIDLEHQDLDRQAPPGGCIGTSRVVRGTSPPSLPDHDERLCDGLVDGSSTASQTMTRAVALRPKTSGENDSSARAGGTTNVPGVVARAR